jgi:hypothetical protein
MVLIPGRLKEMIGSNSREVLEGNDFKGFNKNHLSRILNHVAGTNTRMNGITYYFMLIIILC